MLKTTTKKAIENIRNYIIANFDPSNYEPETTPQTFPEIARFILDCFRSEKYNSPADYRYYNRNEYAVFADWCGGLPSVLDTCYYYNRSAVDDLASILEETESEKAKYNDEQAAENKLTWLIYREITKGAKL